MGDAAKTMDAGGMVLLTQEQLRSLIIDAVRSANGNTVPEYLDVAQVAEWLGVDEKTVRGWIANEGLQAHRLGARLFKLKRADVISWIETKATQPGAHTSRHLERLKRAKAEG